MLRIAILIWSLVATTLAGVFILIVLIVPALADQDSSLIVPAAIAAAVVAAPISYLIAKRLTASMSDPASSE